MSGAWSDTVEELLYDGERLRRRVDLEAATVVVTNHRVLAFTPDLEGANYRHVDRPNVTRVSVQTDSALRQLCWALALCVLGVGVAVFGTTTDLAAPVEGVDGIDDPTGTVDAVLEGVGLVLTVLDLSLLAAAGVLFLGAGVFLVRYVRSRSSRLYIRVSGDADLSVPVTDADLEAGRPAALEATIGPGSDPEPESDPEPGPEPDPDAGPS